MECTIKSKIMKQKISKHFLIATLLIGVLIFSLGEVASARKLPPPVKFENSTICCAGGTRTGQSNDCGQGEGSCVDHQCAAGETETQNFSCP